MLTKTATLLLSLATKLFKMKPYIYIFTKTHHLMSFLSNPAQGIYLQEFGLLLPLWGRVVTRPTLSRAGLMDTGQCHYPGGWGGQAVGNWSL